MAARSFQLKFWQELVLIAVLTLLTVTWCVPRPVAAMTPTQTAYEAYAERLEAVNDIEPGRLRALFKIESNWNPAARGAHGEVGIGQIKPATLLKICPNCGYKAAFLVYGSSGASIARLQKVLGISIDGVFGPATHAAVMSFQGAHGLAVDGIVGPNTWRVAFNEPMPSGNLEAELLDPYKGMRWSAAYWVWLRDRLNTDQPDIIAAAYNSGDAGASVRYMVKLRNAAIVYAGL